MDILNLMIIFAAGLIGGSFGTLVGGASLITIPILIFLGLPPHIAIATNRLGITGLPAAGWYEFHRKRMINYKIGFILGIAALLGAFLGANLVLQVNEAFLKQAVGIMTILILAFIMLKPETGIEKRNLTVKNYEYVAGAGIAFFIGIYGGFYGAGAGTFLSYVLIILFGQTFLESAATRKIAVLFLSVTAAAVFAVKGVIVYPFAAALFIGGFTGSYIGSHYSDRIGNVWIKRMFFVIVLIMAVKLLV